MTSLLDAFPAEDWPQQAIELCSVMCGLSEHHHSKVHLVQNIWPVTERGLYLQRRLAYAMLKNTVQGSVEFSDVTEFKVHNLFPLVSKLSPKVNPDFYLLHSQLLFLDAAVGNEPLKAAEKEDLGHMIELVRGLMGDIRDSTKQPDRAVVKDMMVRMASKWTFMKQAMGSRQMNLYNFATSETKLQVEQVHCSQDSDQSDSEESEQVEEGESSNPSDSEDDKGHSSRTVQSTNLPSSLNDSVSASLEEVNGNLVSSGSTADNVDSQDPASSGREGQTVQSGVNNSPRKSVRMVFRRPHNKMTLDDGFEDNYRQENVPCLGISTKRTFSDEDEGGGEEDDDDELPEL
ncbi:uncharacterized protein LOC106163229 [Lingula anatina]|uniref:Uncharacterized protein LOC106163229 n=1 Tax=Lingula anatina TaxID=7574 RepID=A0A1S3IEC0_LINAN|nr:uncharacterized protein LOC106163229 [Lingula anatina]|eukprot:XP_013396206.1 uncharacterized protein LOC106163229 [Lingula anatina]